MLADACAAHNVTRFQVGKVPTDAHLASRRTKGCGLREMLNKHLPMG